MPRRCNNCVPYICICCVRYVGVTIVSCVWHFISQAPIITLDDCLGNFRKTETLGSDDTVPLMSEYHLSVNRRDAADCLVQWGRWRVVQ